MILTCNQSHPWKEKKWSTETGLSLHTCEVFGADTLLVQMFRDPVKTLIFPVVNGPINIKISMAYFLTIFKFVPNICLLVCLLGYPLLHTNHSKICISLKQHYNFSLSWLYWTVFTGLFKQLKLKGEWDWSQ